MNKYSEEELISGIQNGSDAVIRFVMKRYAENIRKMVADFSLDRYVQPEDIIQDGMVELILNIRQGRFNRKSSVVTYYYSICRFICLKQYNKFREVRHLSDPVDIPDHDPGDPAADERLDRVMKIMPSMKKECVDIINLRFGLRQTNTGYEIAAEKRGFEEVAALLGIEAANARQRFGRCIQSLLAEYRKRSNWN